MGMLTQVKFCYKMAAPARLQLPVDGLPPCLFPVLVKLIDSGVPDLSSHGNNNQTHLNESSLANDSRQETRSWLEFRK